MAARDYISRTKHDGFEWGVNDCSLWVADFVLEITGKDPATDIRGTYDSFISCRRMVAKSGGLLNLWRKCLSDYPTGEAQNGVAVVRSRGQVTGAILSDGFAVLKAKDRVFATREFELLEGWAV